MGGQRPSERQIRRDLDRSAAPSLRQERFSSLPRGPGPRRRLYGRGKSLQENADLAEVGKRGWLDKMYLLLEFPESSKAAKWISRISIVIILASIIVFMLESVPEFRGEDALPELGWFSFESFFSIVFTLEFVLRLVAAPKKGVFWKDALNWMDLIAIVPFYLELLLAAIAGTNPWSFNVDNEALRTGLRLVKLCRVLRVFKMTRQFPASRLILETFLFSVDALLVPMFFLLVFVLIFSAMLYFLEVSLPPPEKSRFYFIPLRQDQDPD